MTAADQRQANSTKAWSEAFSRLCALAGPRGLQTTPELDALEVAAEKASLAYVAGDKDAGAGKALGTWERAMSAALLAGAPEDQACEVCKAEKVVNLIALDGKRVCGRCMRGTKTEPAASITTGGMP